MSIKLDLTKFKHVKSDKHSTTLVHDNGHILNVLHSALSPDGQKQLKALADLAPMDETEVQRSESAPGEKMAEGGEAGVNRESPAFTGKKGQFTKGVSPAGHAVRQGDSESAKNLINATRNEAHYIKPKLKGLAEGGSVKDTYAWDHKLPCLNPSCKSQGRSHPNCTCYGNHGSTMMGAEGGKIPHYCDLKQPHKPDCEYYAGGGSVGVHDPVQSRKRPGGGASRAGEMAQYGAKGSAMDMRNDAKDLHKEKLSELKSMPNPKLKGLADGGEVSDDSQVDRDKSGSAGMSQQQAQDMAKGAQDSTSISEGVDNIKNEVSSWFKANGGEVNKPTASYPTSKPNKGYGRIIQKQYAEGTPDGTVSADDDSTPAGALASIGHMIGHAAKAAYDGFQNKIHDNQMATGAIPASDSKPNAAMPPSRAPNQVNSTPQQMPDNSNAPGQNDDSNSQAGAADPQPQTSVAQQPPPNTANNGMAIPANVKQSLNAPSPEQYRQQQMAQNQAAAAANPQDAAKAQLAQQDAAFEHDLVNGHITPETYKSLFADKSTLGKISTLFGVLIGGAGNGLTHQAGNPVFQQMDQIIKNDLDAQIKSKENAQNFLRINQADLANKTGAMGNAAAAQSQAYDTAQKQALQTSYHYMVTQVAKMPENLHKEQAKKVMGAMYPALMNRINNINDLAVSGASAAGLPYNGINSQAAKPQGGQQGASNAKAPRGEYNQEALNQIARQVNLGMPNGFTPGDVSNATNEAGKLQQVRSFRNNFNNTFQNLDKKFLAGSLNPNDRNAAESALAGEYMKTFGAGADEAHNALKNMLPAYKDWGSARSDKYMYSNKNFDTMESDTPTLDRMKIKNPPNVPPLGGKSSSIPEGATGMYQGKPVVYRNGKWGPK